MVLVLLPVLPASFSQGSTGISSMLGAWGLAAIKLAFLWVLILPVGGKAVTWLLAQLTRSRELAVTAVWALAIVITTGSAWILEAPTAVGALLAGLVIGQAKMNHQSAAGMVPMRDAFAVLFFIALGMLFDPRFVLAHLGLVLACLFVILLVKSLVAGLIAISLGYSVRTVLTVALGLAQVGELSFILAQQAQSLNLLPQAGFNALIASALISIMLSPILFRSVAPLENWLRERKTIWHLLNGRAEQRGRGANEQTKIALARCEQWPTVIVIGYGVVGQRVVSTLRDINQMQVIVDWDVDIIRHLMNDGHLAVYGDGSHPDTLKESGIEHAESLLITLSDLAAATEITIAARSLNPQIRILVRASYIASRDRLAIWGTETITIEEETAQAMVDVLLKATKAQNNGHSDRQRRSG
jgi:CPA2 family monovalent cation:H+ antiporter-2